MKRLDSLIIWLIEAGIYIAVAYFYNRYYKKKKDNRPRHTRKEKEEGRNQIITKTNFFKCIFYVYSKEKVGIAFFISNIIFLILLFLHLLLLILYVTETIVFNDIYIVMINSVLLLYEGFNYLGLAVKNKNKN